MKNVILFNLILFTASNVFGQLAGQVQTYTPGVGGYTDALYNYAMGSISDKDLKSKNFNENIEGSPYADNDFKPSSIYYGSELTGTIFYRYNAYNEEIEIKQKNSDIEPIRGLSKDKKIKLVTSGKPMSFKTFIEKNGDTKNGYLRLLSDGNYKLYKRLKVTFKDTKKAPNSFVKGTPAKFTQFTEYYLESPDGQQINQIQLSNKKVLNLVEKDMKEGLKKYFKENNIKINEEKDLYELLKFLNR